MDSLPLDTLISRVSSRERGFKSALWKVMGSHLIDTGDRMQLISYNLKLERLILNEIVKEENGLISRCVDFYNFEDLKGLGAQNIKVIKSSSNDYYLNITTQGTEFRISDPIVEA